MTSLKHQQEKAREEFAKTFRLFPDVSAPELDEIDDFLDSLIARTRQEVLDEVGAGMPEDRNGEVKVLTPLYGPDYYQGEFNGYQACRSAILAHLKNLRHDS